MLQTEDRERLARIETKVDILLEVQSDHGPRIRSLEHWRSAVVAVVGFIVAVAAYVVPK